MCIIKYYTWYYSVHVKCVDADNKYILNYWNYIIYLYYYENSDVFFFYKKKRNNISCISLTQFLN